MRNVGWHGGADRTPPVHAVSGLAGARHSTALKTDSAVECHGNGGWDRGAGKRSESAE
ncbi:protein of unknown function [Paraburkholderia kururiensis]